MKAVLQWSALQLIGMLCLTLKTPTHQLAPDMQVVTGCGKPGFFAVNKPIFEVQTDSGLLRNTDGGTPMTPIGDRSSPQFKLGLL